MESERIVGEIIRVAAGRCDAHLAQIQDPQTVETDIASAVWEIGRVVGAEIAALVPAGDRSLSVVATTTRESETLGRALSSSLEPSTQASMNFGDARGQDVFSAPIRDLALPDTAGRQVGLLVVGKSILASGCTAVSLANHAASTLHPNRLVVAALFYSESSLAELADTLPQADIVLVGEPAGLRSDGLLDIGVIPYLT